LNKVYIIIVTYNALPWIDRCLQSCGNYPVIVVDNASTDQTVAHIQTNYPKVTLLPQNKNLGFGQGNNAGISYALKQGAEQVLLLNQDAYLVENCLEILIEKQQQNPQFGILSPIHLNGKGDALDRNFGNYISPQKVPELISDLILNKPKEFYEVPFVNAAGWLISQKCLHTVGGFDPIFFHYGEDDNYCQRVNYHGFKVGVVTSVFLKHDRENREVEKPEKYSPLYYEYMVRHYKINFGNINLEGIDAMNEEVKRLEKNILKLQFQFRYKSALKVTKQLEILKKQRENIKKSRELNSVKGMHYL
jgi:GT2 family glycosyltransferase